MSRERERMTLSNDAKRMRERERNDRGEVPWDSWRWAKISRESWNWAQLSWESWSSAMMSIDKWHWTHFWRKSHWSLAQNAVLGRYWSWLVKACAFHHGIRFPTLKGKPHETAGLGLGRACRRLGSSDCHTNGMPLISSGNPRSGLCTDDVLAKIFHKPH